MGLELDGFEDLDGAERRRKEERDMVEKSEGKRALQEAL